MGLDTSHNCFHGAYSGFNRFRRWVAKNIGYSLDEFVEFGGFKDSAELEDHDLFPFLFHSDCEGYISPSDCKKIADGLDAMLKKIPLVDKIGDMYCENLRNKAIMFRDGCLEAYKAGESVEFH